MVKSHVGFSCPSSSPEQILSWQSCKKLLPASCGCMEGPLLAGLAEKFAAGPQDLPDGYLNFVATKCQALFKKFWDRHYDDFCLRTSPPISGVLESGRSEGGTMGMGMDRISYLDLVQGKVLSFSASTRASALVVQSAGKPRPLTKFSADSLLLKPLHDTLYDHVSRRNWVLRGEPDKQKFNEAGFRKEDGFCLVSGDYASATDGLSIEVAEVILRAARRTSGAVPDSVWDYAEEMLRPLITFPQGSFRVSRGQMMGSYLSFPLLCIQNWLAFEWTKSLCGIRAKWPVIINGDDILFGYSTRDCPGFYDAWVRELGRVGLTVEMSKTGRSFDTANVNSTLLGWDKRGRLSVIPTLRLSQLAPRELPVGLGRDFSTFVRSVPPDVAFVAAKEFFKWHVSSLRRMGRFHLAEFDFRGRLALRMSKIFGLFRPEDRYLKLPVPPAKHDVVIPDDLIVRVPSESVGDELRALNLAEMTCWKWSHDFKPVENMVRYCVRLSCMRPEKEPDVRPFDRPIDMGPRWIYTCTPPSSSSAAALFFSPPEVRETLLFRELLSLQDFSVYEALPPYEAVELEYWTSLKPDLEASEANAALGGHGIPAKSHSC